MVGVRTGSQLEMPALTHLEVLWGGGVGWRAVLEEKGGPGKESGRNQEARGWSEGRR